MCHNHILSHLLEKNKVLHSIEAGYPPFTLLQTFPFLLLTLSLFAPLFPFLLSSPQMLYPLSCISSFLSNRLLSGHASDPSVIFLYAFYLNFISDFVIIYSLIYLGLFMHAVCETDSCIYQWNRVRS